jgi:hypothetical protein
LNEYIKRFKAVAEKNNIIIYLCAFETFQSLTDIDLQQNFDAAIEFQPHSTYLSSFIQEKVQKKNHDPFFKAYNTISKLVNSSANEHLVHRVKYWLKYNEYVDFVLRNHKFPQTYKRYPGVTPMWDNTARRGKWSFMLKNENPEKYKEWLLYHKHHFKPYSEEENFLFINAWNEWAEGNHLEPCAKWGRKYLEVTKDAFST